jgi:hypothetical protein
MKVDGQFSLDKVLTDGRHSPTQLIPNPNKDVILFDQHREKTPNGEMVEYKRAVGILKSAENVDGKFKFNWIITDSNIREIAKNAKYPEKLFTYSPEHIPINKTKEYDQGVYGIVDAIAITNFNNDDEAITTKIWNKIQETFKSDDNGDSMKENEVKEMIKNQLEESQTNVETLIDEKLDKVNEVLGKLDGVDFEAIKKIPGALETLETQIGEVKGNVDGLLSTEDLEKNQLIQKIVSKGVFTEESIKNMKMPELQKLGEQFEIEFDGVMEHNHKQKTKDIFDEIKDEYGVDLKPKEE